MPQPPADAAAALHRAVSSLTDGHFDPRTPEGAQANALEAIAWSLIGLLQARTQDEIGEEAVHEGLSEALLASGFVRIPPRD